MHRNKYNYQRRLELENEITAREWSERIYRLNSRDHNECYVDIPPKHTPSIRSYRESPVFLECKRSIENNSVQSRCGTAPQCRSDCDRRSTPSREEIEDMRRCFRMADIGRTGYLDCEGLKTFMEYRKTPITHMAARNLIAKSDPEHNFYINFEQILTLAFNCGLGTQSERKISSASFTDISQGLKHAASKHHNNARTQTHRRKIDTPVFTQSWLKREECFHEPDPQPQQSSRRRGNVVEENLELHGAISKFEDIALNVEKKATDENIYLQYRRELRERQRKPIQQPEQSGFSPPPGWATMILPSQDPSCHEPQRSVDTLKTEWERKWPKPEPPPEHKSSIDKIRFHEPVPLPLCKDLGLGKEKDRKNRSKSPPRTPVPVPPKLSVPVPPKLPVPVPPKIPVSVPPVPPKMIKDDRKNDNEKANESISEKPQVNRRKVLHVRLPHVVKSEESARIIFRPSTSASTTPIDQISRQEFH